MAVQNGGVETPRASEETPLLGGDEGRGDGDDGSSEMLTHGEVDIDKANQQVGSGRGFLIVLSFYGLIFLQGKLNS